MASSFDAKRQTSPAIERARKAALEKATEKLNEKLTEKLSEKLNAKIAKQTDKAIAKTVHHIEKLGILADRLAAVDLWTRAEPGVRRPRYSRDLIADEAMAIADAEGLEALSMRRIAAQLEAGTMTLYHYVRTKDELLALLVDAFFGEVIVPADAVWPQGWRASISLIAERTKAALERHPWVLDIADDPRLGPNAVRHFDQAWQALAGLSASFDEKLDLIMAVDELVFGFVMHGRSDLHHAEAESSELVGYVGELLRRGSYPALTALVYQIGLPELWSKIADRRHDMGRFDRNLAKLLAGFENGFGRQ